MGAQYTPTPWAVADGPEIYSVPAYRSVAMALADGNEDANAAFIVRACNAHDDLVGALDPDTLEAIADEIECFEHSARAHGLRSIAKRQRAALAKAEAAQ